MDSSHAYQIHPYMIISDNQQEIPIHENGFFPILVKDDSTEWHPSYAIPAHWHQEIEMTYILEGTGEYLVNGVSCSLPTGSVIMVPSNHLHAARYSTHYHTEVFLIHPDILNRHAVYLRPYLRFLENGEPEFLLFDGSQPWHAEIRKECALLFQTCMDREYAYEPLAMSCVYRILGIINRYYQAAHADQRAIVYTRSEMDSLRIMMTYVQEHYAEPFHIDHLAAVANISRSTCDKLFRKVLNQSPTDYIIYIRLTQSMRLLQQGLPVTEVAAACGFHSLPYYSRLFRSRIGMTPMAYQKNRPQ